MDWFLYDNGLRHERVNKDTSTIHFCNQNPFEKNPQHQTKNVGSVMFCKFVLELTYLLAIIILPLNFRPTSTKRLLANFAPNVKRI